MPLLGPVDRSAKFVVTKKCKEIRMIKKMIFGSMHMLARAVYLSQRISGTLLSRIEAQGKSPTSSQLLSSISSQGMQPKLPVCFSIRAKKKGREPWEGK